MSTCSQLRNRWLIFFFNDTATTEIYTLSLHDALPISRCGRKTGVRCEGAGLGWLFLGWKRRRRGRSEEHTSELQSRLHLVCRLLLEKKKVKLSIVATFITLRRLRVILGLSVIVT